jgi:hypothetical protein
MFSDIIKHLPDFNILAINVAIWGSKKGEMEKELGRLGLTHLTMPRLSKNCINIVLEVAHPQLIVLASDMGQESILFIESSNEMHIPTLLIQDGILGQNIEGVKEGRNVPQVIAFLSSLSSRLTGLLKNKEFSIVDKFRILLFELQHGDFGKKKMYGHGGCTKIAVFGEATKSILISEGIDPQKIVPIGSPKFDTLFKTRDTNSKEIICNKYNITPDTEIIVLLTQYYVESHIWTPLQRENFVVSIIQAVEQIPHAQLIIKIRYPREREEDYYKIVERARSNAIIVGNIFLPELLNACSLAITESSTAALEAMILSKPVLFVNLYDDKSAAYYGESGALFATKANEILPTIKSLLFDSEVRKILFQKTQKFINNQIRQQDGESSVRISEFIRSMANNEIRKP